MPSGVFVFFAPEIIMISLMSYKKSDRRQRPAVNLAPCICAAAVVYISTLPCCAQCKTRPCLADASTDADKRFAYVDKTYLMCYI